MVRMKHEGNTEYKHQISKDLLGITVNGLGWLNRASFCTDIPLKTMSTVFAVW
jgi:hypothetical protein